MIKQADIVVGAVGKPQFIKSDKDGAVVIDAGYHAGGVGDIELAGIHERASAYTPVPGGNDIVGGTNRFFIMLNNKNSIA